MFLRLLPSVGKITQSYRVVFGKTPACFANLQKARKRCKRRGFYPLQVCLSCFCYHCERELHASYKKLVFDTPSWKFGQRLLLLPRTRAQSLTGFTRSWKVMEFDNAFSRPGKVMNFRKKDRGHGKATKFHFLVQIFRAVWKLETRAKVYSIKDGFLSIS